MSENQNSAQTQRLRRLAQPLLGKWVPFIVLALSDNERNFAQLEREISGISRKVLAQNLQQLREAGIIEKLGESSTGHPVTYRLTPLGKSFSQIFFQVKKWIIAHQNELENPKK